jgi:hypothetical protein
MVSWGWYYESINELHSTGIEHYMFGTPFAAIAQGLQSRATPSQSQKKPG